MSQNNTYQLNAGQLAVAEAFIPFLLGDERELNIVGPGGVGKTLLMGHLIDEIIPKYRSTCEILGIKPEFDEVVMTAITNKATDVLSAATRRPCSTIYSFMNLKVQDNYSTGQSTIKKSSSWKVHTDKIIFIDEASMVDSKLRAYIREGTFNCKIVYVGDHCQLAPVNELISPIYADPSIQLFELTQPMRTNCPHLQNLNQVLRDRVKDETFGDIQLVPGIIDWLDGPDMEIAVQQHFSSFSNDDRILAYTNDCVRDYNKYIRGYRGLPDHIVTGEVLVNNNQFALTRGTITHKMSVEEQVTVKDASKAPKMKTIAPGVELMIQEVDLVNKFGMLMESVEVPIDADHYSRTLKWAAYEKNWPLYYLLKNSYPDLREREACTTYKAQGSTYNTVFIDLSDIGDCRRPDVARRLLYVAVSRARSRVVFYGELPEKYGRIIL